MPEIAEPPKKSFTAAFAANRPSTEAELQANQPSKPVPQKPPEPTPEVSKVTTPATSPPDPDAEIESGRRAPRSEDFKRIKSSAEEAKKERDALKAKTSEYEKELGELRKAPKHNADLIKQIEKERDEYKAKFEQVAVEISPERQAAHQQRLNSIVESVKSLAGPKADEILSIFQMPDGERKRRALAEAVEDMDPITVDDLNAARRDYTAAQSQRQAEIANAHKTLETLGTERQKKAEERLNAYAKSFESVLNSKSTGDDALDILKPKEGDSPEVAAWNEGVAETKKVAKAIFFDEFETPEEKASAAIHAASAPRALAALKASNARVAELEAALAKIQGSSPSLTGGGAIKEGGPKKTFSQKFVDNSI